MDDRQLICRHKLIIQRALTVLVYVHKYVNYDNVADGLLVIISSLFDVRLL